VEGPFRVRQVLIVRDDLTERSLHRLYREGTFPDVFRISLRKTEAL